MDHTQYTTNGAERKPGTHLTMEDRGAIQAMKKLGHSNRAIARYLHCAPSTISNELKRGTPPRTGSRGRAPGYSAKRGDAVYKENRKNSHKPHRIDKCTSFVQWVVTQVRTEKWSIDACVGYARKNKLFPEEKMVCTKTLYNEVWGGNLSLNILELPEAIKRKKHHKSPVKRKKVYGTSIDERPEIVDSRTEEGHWEGDTVVGKRNGKESVILTLLEKKTQNYIAIRIPGKTSEAVNTAMERLHEEFGEKFS
ncbi:IS30 family transposase, partial [Neglectibacter timonensis]